MNGRRIREYAYIVTGSAVAGLGIALFSIPQKIAGGGVNGMATILYHLLGFDPGVTMLAINIPLILLGIKVFGVRYGARSILGSVLLSLWTSFFGCLTGYAGVLHTGDRLDVLLAAIFGGALVGAGIGIVMKCGANTGGTDIVAQILHKYSPLSMGVCSFIPDALVILAGISAFGLERGLFAIIDLYVSSKMVNFVVMDIGSYYAKTAYIFSSKDQEIGRRVIKELHHGGTLFHGTGIYSGQKRNMLMVVVPNQQIGPLEAIVHEEDPDAFMLVVDAYQVLGEGFLSMSRTLEPLHLDEQK